MDLTYQVQPRQRPDRHPYQIGVLAGLFCVALSQLIIGVPPESALYGGATHTTLIALDVCFIIGSALVLLAATLPRHHDPRLSLRLGIFGEFAVFAATLCYVGIVLSITDAPYWLSVLSAGVGVGICYASAHRIVQQRKALRDIKRVIAVVHPEDSP